MPAAEHPSTTLAREPQPTLMPSAAERARTLLEFASSVVLDIPGVDLTARPGIPPLVRCAALPGAAVAVLVAADSPLYRVASTTRGSELRGELDVIDVAPVPVPYRIRARAGATGRLTVLPASGRLHRLFPGLPADGQALLRLDLDHLAVEDLWGTQCCVDLDTFAAAAPDPIAADEASLLQHLAARHADQLRLLGAWSLEHPSMRTSWPGSPAPEVRPVALDRYGLRVRLLDGPAMLDARFEFPEPVGTPAELPEAMRRIFHRPGVRS